ncbi:hypothetical protein Gogos_019525, partial [Gossypium gossypioides]|nr:hypothetical protein [Gossypium gossypioides]
FRQFQVSIIDNIRWKGICEDASVGLSISHCTGDPDTWKVIRSKNDMHIRKATPAYGKDDEIIISMGNGYGKEDTNILSFGGFHEEYENGKEDTNIISFGGFHEEHEIVLIDCSVLLKLQN